MERSEWRDCGRSGEVERKSNSGSWQELKDRSGVFFSHAQYNKHAERVIGLGYHSFLLSIWVWSDSLSKATLLWVMEAKSTILILKFSWLIPVNTWAVKKSSWYLSKLGSFQHKFPLSVSLNSLPLLTCGEGIHPSTTYSRVQGWITNQARRVTAPGPRIH